MSTDLSFTSSAGDYRQLRLNGTTSIIPTTSVDYAGVGTPSAANTAQAVFARGFTTEGYGFPFRGVPANLTLQDAPPGAYQLRFNGTASILSFSGVGNPDLGTPSIANTARAAFAVGFAAGVMGTPFVGKPTNLTLQAPVPNTTALVIGAPAVPPSFLPVPSLVGGVCGSPNISNVAIGVFMQGFGASVYGSPFAGKPTDLIIQSALPVGQPLDLYFNYGDALRPPGVQSLVFGTASAANTGRALYPQGVNALAFGGWQIGGRTVPGISGGDVFTPGAATIQNWIRYVNPTGTNQLGFGAASASNVATGLWLQGYEAFAAGQATIQAFNRTVSPIGLESLQYGTPATYNLNRNLALTGADMAQYGDISPYNVRQIAPFSGLDALSFGTNLIRSIDTWVYFAGTDWLVVNSPQFSYTAYGADMSVFGVTQITHSTRSVQIKPFSDFTQFSPFDIHNLNRELLATGIPAPTYTGENIIRDKTSRVYVSPSAQDDYGTITVIGPRWVYQTTWLDDAAPGHPTAIESWNGQIHAYGIPPRNKYGIHYIYNNAQRLELSGFDDAVLPKIVSVDGPIRAVYPTSAELPYASDYTVIYNAALAIYPIGTDTARYGSGLDSANLNRTFKIPPLPAPDAGTPWASFAVRQVIHEARRSPDNIIGPLVVLRTNYVYPTGRDFYGDALASVFEHFNIVKPLARNYTGYGRPSVSNLTPEIYMSGRGYEIEAEPTVFNLLQIKQAPTAGDDMAFGVAAIGWRNRTVQAIGSRLQALGTPLVYEDLLSAPITRRIPFEGIGWNGSNQPIGIPKVRTNQIFAGGLASSVRFGTPHTLDQYVVFQGNVEGAAYDLNQNRVSKPRVLMKYTQYAYVHSDDLGPVQLTAKHLVLPNYVYPGIPNPTSNSDFWANVADERKADNMWFGGVEVQHKNRTFFANSSMNTFATYGTPATAMTGPRRINMTGLDSLYYGWSSAGGGQQSIDTFDGEVIMDFNRIGPPSVRRPAPPPDPNLYPAGIHTFVAGGTRIDTFHRSRVIGGTDMQQLPKFVVTPPFFVTPIDTDLARYGTLYTDHRIRTIMHIGEDMFLSEPDFYGGDETTVSTPTPPAPAQYVYVKGRKPPECCWGFYIGRGA